MTKNLCTKLDGDKFWFHNDLARQIWQGNSTKLIGLGRKNKFNLIKFSCLFLYFRVLRPSLKVNQKQCYFKWNITWEHCSNVYWICLMIMRIKKKGGWGGRVERRVIPLEKNCQQKSRSKLQNKTLCVIKTMSVICCIK